MTQNKKTKFPYIPKYIKDTFRKTSELSLYERQLSNFESVLKPKKKSKVLEIGGGEGITLVTLELNGYDAYSIEPKEKYVENARMLLKENGIDTNKVKQGYSEEIPFPDNFFDYVISYQVIEHVGDVTKTFKEVERVLKPGGETLHICPNYRSFYEGHYRVLMLPFMNKKMFKIYISILKKIFFWKRFASTSYIDDLNFVTADQIRDISNKHLRSLSISDRAPEILKERKKSRAYKNDPDWGKGESLTSRMIKRSVIMIGRVKLADPIVDFIIKRGYFVHLYIVGQKANENK